jgi:hypothetical protein
VKSEVSVAQSDPLVKAILEELLLLDIDITAREVARRHPTLKAASSITRDVNRREAVIVYRQRQQEMRRWAERTQKNSSKSLERILADKDARIAELEAQVQILTGSHIAMVRALGESGGFRAWSRFFETSVVARDSLVLLGAVPSGDIVNLKAKE